MIHLSITAITLLALAAVLPAGPATAQAFVPAVVFDMGGKFDKSFNEAAYNGAERFKKETGIAYRAFEVTVESQREQALRTMARRGSPLVVGIGFAQASGIEKVAREFSSLKFAIVDSVVDLPNVQSIVFKEHEGSFLVGMAAALASKSGKIGFVGGMDIPLIRRFEKGYEEGAKAVNPAIQVVQNYVGVTDAAWNNPGKGKELSLAQMDKGADVIFAAAGNSGLGAFDAVEQAGTENGRATHFVIGVDSNQNGVKPGFVLTSMVKRVDNAVYDIVKEVVDGQFKGGFHVFGLESGDE